MLKALRHASLPEVRNSQDQPKPVAKQYVFQVSTLQLRVLEGQTHHLYRDPPVGEASLSDVCFSYFRQVYIGLLGGCPDDLVSVRSESSPF